MDSLNRLARQPVVGVLGPSRPDRVGVAAGIEPELYSETARMVGQLAAKLDCGLVVVPDRGVAVSAMNAYLEAGGGRLIGICPGSGVSEPEANSSISANRHKCHEVLSDLTWFEQHSVIGSVSDAMVCVGLSSGTVAELAWTKWNRGPRTALVKGTYSMFPPELAVEGSVEEVEDVAIEGWIIRSVFGRAEQRPRRAMRTSAESRMPESITG